MKSIIRWAIDNSPAMNTLMIASLLVGAASLVMMNREVFPEFELEIILVSVPYPGASPEEVEEGICQKIEEACKSISGIKNQTAVAKEGSGFLVLELEPASNVQKILNEVRSEIDQIPSFPELAEDPDVKQITFRTPAIYVGVLGPVTDDPDAEIKLREVAEMVRDDLLHVPVPPAENLFGRMIQGFSGATGQIGITSASITGEKPYQIDVEIPEETLRRHGLTLEEIAGIIRRENLELPGGNVRTSGQEIRIRGKNKRSIGIDIEEIQVLSREKGDLLTIADLGTVEDAFDDSVQKGEISVEVDGKIIPSRPALKVKIERSSSEDLLQVVNTAKHYVKTKSSKMPPGYSLTTWGDQSIDVRERLEMLTRNGIQGLILVFLVLAIFLDLKLAFWVALGIPIAVLGAGYILPLFGQTLNMLSMFAFLMALGIVVDDAIVIGENIYEHRNMGKGYVRAAIDGTIEVIPSVCASVTTTIIAFAPLLFVSGVMGKFIAVMPIAVIAMLLISLLESTFILPCHLAHENNAFFKVLGVILYPFRPLLGIFRKVNRAASSGMQGVIRRLYVPSLRWSLDHKLIILSCSFVSILLAMGTVKSGIVPLNLFPKLDGREIRATVLFPDGTSKEFADRASKRMADVLLEINDEEIGSGSGRGIVDVVYRSIGSGVGQDPLGSSGVISGGHIGVVEVGLVRPADRDIKSEELLSQWRARVDKIEQDWIDGKSDPNDPDPNPFAGSISRKFESAAIGPGGTPIEFLVLADKDDVGALEEAVEACKAELSKIPGVYDVDDDSNAGKWEMHIKIKDDARAMGISLDEVARTVRSSFYGEEVMRLQRGRHDVKLMVRYPEDERNSLEHLKRIRVRTQDGVERPVTELADITFVQGISEINRKNQKRSITVSADVDEKMTNADDVSRKIKEQFIPGLMAKYQEAGTPIEIRWEGRQQQNAESVQSLQTGFLVALMVMFVVLTIEFRAYFQPMIIMCVIPFGFVGAVVGHLFMGQSMTLFSLFGLVALTGVVVNDSIVLVDFINKRLKDGLPIKDAIVEAGRRRFRPVWLTSMTTIAGLIPMLTETSFQAQILIPMATSLCFGLLFATFFVLVVVPVYFDIYASITGHRGVPMDSSNDDQDVMHYEPTPPISRSEDEAAGVTPPMISTFSDGLSQPSSTARSRNPGPAFDS